MDIQSGPVEVSGSIMSKVSMDNLDISLNTSKDPLKIGYTYDSFICECAMRLYYAIDFSQTDKNYGNIAEECIKKAKALADLLQYEGYLK